MKEKTNEIKEEDIIKYDKFPKLPCRVLRRHVFHGVKETNDKQVIVCLACGDMYEMHKNGRNKTEKSLWDSYQEFKDQVNLDPPPEKRHKKKWSIRHLIVKRGSI